MNDYAQFEEIGYWSELKLEIVKEYAQPYSRILAAQRKPPLHHIYIDAFAGSGVHVSETSGQFVLGSPLNALNVDPPFREYHLVDIQHQKVETQGFRRQSLGRGTTEAYRRAKPRESQASIAQRGSAEASRGDWLIS